MREEADASEGTCQESRAMEDGTLDPQPSPLTPIPEPSTLDPNPESLIRDLSESRASAKGTLQPSTLHPPPSSTRDSLGRQGNGQSRTAELSSSSSSPTP